MWPATSSTGPRCTTGAAHAAADCADLDVCLREIAAWACLSE
jgi:hypothetical protein